MLYAGYIVQLFNALLAETSAKKTLKKEIVEQINKHTHTHKQTWMYPIALHALELKATAILP